MQINAIETGLSAAYQAAINAAVSFYDSVITSNITITINFMTETSGYASSQQLSGQYVSYSTLKSALSSHATSDDDLASIAALPASNPFGTSSYYVPTAEAIALGLASQTSTAVGDVWLNTAQPWTYDPNNRAVSGEFDAIGALEHEISEVLGRNSGSDGSLFLEAESLHRYSSAGVIDTSTSYANAYFSVDGKTMLKQIGEQGSDIADWSSNTSGDSFGYLDYDSVQQVTAIDLREMDILGYTIAGSSPSVPHTNNLAGLVHTNDLTHSSTVNSAYAKYDYIDGLNYIASFDDLIVALGANASAGQSHFLTYGMNEGRVSTFDGLDYVASYGDLINAFASAGSETAVEDSGAAHFITYGVNEGRKTTFNGLDYIASYQDLIKALGADNDAGAYHYIEYGVKEGRTTSFDGLDYIASYGDLINAFGANEQAGAEHFITYGSNEGRSTTFNGLDYIASYGDLIKAFGVNGDAGASHYINYGSHEGRTITFDGLAYIADYADLMKAFGANEQAGAAHYISYGINEGRSTTFNVSSYISGHSDLVGKYTTNDQFLSAYISTYAMTGHILT